MSDTIREGLREIQEAKDLTIEQLSEKYGLTAGNLEQDWIVYVCPNHQYDNGDLVVVALNSDEVMIKKLRQKDGMMVLQSINPTYEPLVLVPDGYRFTHKVCLIKSK